MRRLICVGVLLGLLLQAPLLSAQDSTIVRRTTNGEFLVNFSNQDIGVVLTALAAAAGINIQLNNVVGRTSLNLVDPLTRDELVAQIRSISEANGLTVTQDGAVTRISRAQPVPAGRGGQAAQPAAQAAASFYPYMLRLKYASAAQLAPVLQTLLGTGGAAGRGGVTTTIGPNGAIIQQTVPLNAAPAATPAPAGGRGGAAGAPGAGGAAFNNNAGDVTFTTTVDPATGQQTAVAAQRLQAVLGNLGNLSAAQQQQIQAAAAAAGGPLAAALAQGLAQQAQPAGTPGLTLQAVSIVPEPTTNALLIRATAQDYQIIQQLVQGLDVRPPQVLIEVTIAEVTRTHDLNVGVSGTVNDTKNGATTPRASGTIPQSTTVDAARDFVLQLAGGGGTIDFNTAIHALSTLGTTRVLSMPVIIAQNNRQAILNVGQRRPFVSVSQSVPNDPTATVQTVQYIDVATTLTITPTINPDGYVNLVVQQTANTATNEIAFNAPVLSTREATTQIFVRDGQTVVVGGLAGKSVDETRERIPLLGSIPILGNLFGATRRNTTTTELFLFLTPHVMFDDQDADRMRNAVRNGTTELKQVIPDGPMINPEAKTLNVTPTPTPPAPGAQPAAPRQ